MSALIDEWINAAGYILGGGNPDVILCERGIRTFETKMRNTLDLAAVAWIKRNSELPVIVDPSHGTGRPELIGPMTLAAAAAGADGVLIEVHPEPGRALVRRRTGAGLRGVRSAYVSAAPCSRCARPPAHCPGMTDRTPGRMPAASDPCSPPSPEDTTVQTLSLSGGLHHQWRNRVVDWSGARPGSEVLDCATGTGDLALAFARTASAAEGRVVGTDFCEEMLALAPAKAHARSLHVVFELADVTALPFDSDSFDIASIAFGIRNVSDPSQALRELSRVVRPGGRVMVLESASRSAHSSVRSSVSTHTGSCRGLGE